MEIGDTLSCALALIYMHLNLGLLGLLRVCILRQLSFLQKPMYSVLANTLCREINREIPDLEQYYVD